jgi:Rab-like protein 3
VTLHEYKEDTAQQKTFWVEFWDIGGSLGHKNTRAVFYSQINGIILVHDLTNRKSCENLTSWLMEIINKESGKDTIAKSSFADDLDSEQFLGTCQVSLVKVAFKVFHFQVRLLLVSVADSSVNLWDEGRLA